MTRSHSKFRAKLNSHIAKLKPKKPILTPTLAVLLCILTAGLGYIGGTYHYQIEAAIGPVFGYKAHSGEIDLSSVQLTYSQLAAHFDGQLNVNDLIQGANRGLVQAAGDTYTTYFSPKEAVDFNNSLNGNIGGGIGAEIGIKNSKVTVIRTLKNNPAVKAGLMANDVVLSVNDQDVTGWSVEKVVSNIRGEEGTTVKIKVLRGSETKEFSITRAIIDNPSVESNVEGTVGTMTISRFDGETGTLAKAAAQDFVKQGVKSVILDLRDNGGGYVSSAVEVAGIWLDNKIVVTERSGDTVKDQLRSGSNTILAGIPTVVIVNGGTASASEIVSGALQDYKAAKIVGEKTFGKGSVQLPINLNGGAEIKVTVAKWYTPNGKNISKEGISPDQTATLTQSDIDKSVDPQLDAAKKLLGL